MIFGVPDTTPVTTPLPMPIVAWDVLLLDHVPPGVASVNVVVDPTHTLAVPPIADGNGLMVITDDVTHPVGAV